MSYGILTEDESREMFTSLSEIYISIHLFDLKKNELKPFKSNRFIDSLADACILGQDKVNNVMKNIPLEEHVEMMLEFVDFSTLPERLKDKNDISIVFEGRYNGWCRARFIAMGREDGVLTRTIFTVECINEEKQRENHLLYLAGTDLMTGIFNRGHGESRIVKYLKEDRKGVFCLFDVDKFKMINDNYGHNAGDLVLIAVAECLQRAKREHDIIMRLGGDEFAAFFTDIGRDEIHTVIEKLFEDIESIKVKDVKQPIRVSLGAVVIQHGMDFDTAYKLADKGVYESKNTKGSSYSII